MSSAEKGSFYTEVEVFISLEIFHNLLPLFFKFLKQNFFKGKCSLYKPEIVLNLYNLYLDLVLKSNKYK